LLRHLVHFFPENWMQVLTVKSRFHVEIEKKSKLLSVEFAVYHWSKTTFGPRHMNGVSLLLQSPSQHCNGHLHYSFSDYHFFPFNSDPNFSEDNPQISKIFAKTKTYEKYRTLIFYPYLWHRGQIKKFLWSQVIFCEKIYIFGGTLLTETICVNQYLILWECFTLFRP